MPTCRPTRSQYTKMIPPASSPVGLDILSSNSNSPQQDRLKTLRRAQSPLTNGSGGRQGLLTNTSSLISIPSEPRSIGDKLTKQRLQPALDTAKRKVLQYNHHTTNPQRHERKTQVSNNDSISHSASKQKVLGARVAKSSTTTTTKSAISKSHSGPALGGPFEGGGEAAIKVFINNRLGSRAAIICSPSDTIGDFKKLAELQLGTRAEAIRLKRQGHRALRDAMTLEDYEIGNGSSLDYEIDTT